MQTLRGKTIAGEHETEDFVASARQNTCDFTLRSVEKTLRDQIARERVAGHCALTGRRHSRRLFGEQLFDYRRVKVEILDVIDALVLFSDWRRDGQPDFF